MSALVEAMPASKDTTTLASKMKEEERKTVKTESNHYELRENVDIGKDLSKEISKKAGENEDDTEVKKDDYKADSKSESEMNAGSQSVSNKPVEKDDKTDVSLSKEKDQLPRSIEVSAVADSKEPAVQILSLSVISPGRPDVVLPIPFPATTSKATLFTLKEGSKYRIKFHLTVSRNTVKNLTYSYMVWKSGIRVHQTKKMVGTFSPQQEPYVYELEEGTTPTGYFARGPFCVRSKFVDDDGNCYLDTNYYFDIRKDWGAREKC